MQKTTALIITAHGGVNREELHGVDDSQFVKLSWGEKYGVAVQVLGAEFRQAGRVPYRSHAKRELVAPGGGRGLAMAPVTVLVRRVAVGDQFQV